MEACPESLPDDPLLLKALVRSLFQKNSILENKNTFLEERLRILLHKQFGASSEKTSPDQQELFNEAEQDQPEPSEPEPEENVTVAEHSRNKKGRKPLPKDLPRIRQEHDMGDDEKNCNCCGGELHRVGEDVTEQLDIIPAKIRVIQNVRFKYGCRSCEEGISLPNRYQAVSSVRDC